MATSTFRNKNKVRPIKKGAAKRARVKAQKKRLVEMGFGADEVVTMPTNKIHAYLRTPKITKKLLDRRAAAKAEAPQA